MPTPAPIAQALFEADPMHTLRKALCAWFGEEPIEGRDLSASVTRIEQHA